MRGERRREFIDFLQQRNSDSKDWLAALEPHLERLIMYDYPPVPSPCPSFIVPSFPSSICFVDIHDLGRKNLIACSSDYVLTAISVILQSSTLSVSACAILTYVPVKEKSEERGREQEI